MPDYSKLLEDYREKGQLTQEAMAGLLDVSTRTYQTIVKTGKIKLVDVLEKANKILGLNTQNISRETNGGGKGNGNGYLEERRIKKNQAQPYMVPLLPVKAYTGYVKSYDQTDYLSTLEQYALPPGINPIGAIWRYFEVGGDSMEPTFYSGDVVLGSQVAQEDWTQLRNFYIYIIVTTERVMIKRIYMKSSMQWVLISDNEKQYPQQLQDVDEVKELWVFRRHINKKAAPPKEFKIKV